MKATVECEKREMADGRVCFTVLIHPDLPMTKAGLATACESIPDYAREQYSNFGWLGFFGAPSAGLRWAYIHATKKGAHDDR